MSDTPSYHIERNPFSTRFVRPGAAPFLFRDGGSAQATVARLERQAWRGQIVGAHGSGKSTLVETLIPLAKAAGMRVVRFDIRGGRRPALNIPRRLDRRSLIVVDGYEQLSWFARLRLAITVIRARAGLLVTAHRATWLPDLFQTRVDPELARDVVRQLTRGEELVRDDDIAHAVDAHQGNLREVLFTLYELYELRKGRASRRESSDRGRTS